MKTIFLCFMTQLVLLPVVAADAGSTHNQKPTPVLAATAMDRDALRMTALAAIESGGNDHAVGRAGEVSRYQIKPLEWWRVSTTPLSQATEPAAALTVTRRILDNRCAAFAARFHRAPTDFEFYVLWNAPNQLLLGNGPTAVVRERAERFANLVNAA